MRVRASTLVAGVFLAAAAVSTFVVSQVVNSRREAGAGAPYAPKGAPQVLDPGAAADRGAAGVGWLSGRVSSEIGKLPPGTSVFAQRSGGSREEPARALANDRGAYRLELPEGDYRVWAATAGGADVRARPAFARVERGRTLTIDLAAASPLAGPVIEVLEPGGAASAEAMVTLARPGDARLALATPAGEDGRVGIAPEMGLAGREVEVRARNGGRTGSWTGVLPDSGAVTVRLVPAGAVAGRVVASGKAVPPVGFVLTVASQPAPQAWRTLAEHRFTGDAFAVPDLPPEPIRLSVKTDDGRRGTALLTLAPGEERTLEIAVAAP